MLSLLAAACAADSQRFAGFSGVDKMATGSLPPADVPGGQQAPSYGGGSYGANSYGANPAGAQRSAAVETSTLPPPSGAGQSSYQPPAQSSFSSVRPDQVQGSANGWTAIGGARVTVGQGDTVQSIANRYGVPPAAIRAANNLGSGSVTPGASIVIPVYNPSASASASASAPASAPTARPVQQALAPKPAPSSVQVVRAQPQQPAPQATVSAQERAKQVIAASRNVVQQPAAQPAQPTRVQAQVKAPVQAPAKPQQPQKVVAQPQPVKQVAQAAPKQVEAPKQAAAPEAKEAPRTQVASAPEASTAKAESASGSFRWPARGRIIQGFNGRGGSEGINIALPEGTPVKAAEGGVVAYAGSELKGYGNLVLIRHDNGWVSAYANNGDLKVKRGDRVSRGQVVATSGQTGNVSTPQLHFELRKGSTPVDPLPHLSGG